MKVQMVYAQMVQDRLDSVRRNLGRVLPHVDSAVVVDNGSTDGTREWLRSQEKVTLVERDWNDSFVGGRNAYLDGVARIAGDDPTILLTADDDELYCDALLRDLRTVSEDLYYDDLNVLRIRSRSVELDWKAEVHWEKMDDWHKPLVYVWEPGMRYVGVNNSEVHEDISIPSGFRQSFLNDQGLYWYAHVKRYGEIWPRAIRNAFAGGGGMNLGELCPWWRDFTRMVGDRTGAKTSAEFLRYLKGASSLDPEIAAFFHSKRLIGTKWDDTLPQWPGWPNGTSEWREGWLSYYVFYHPENIPFDAAREMRDIGYFDPFRATCIIHGPNAPEAVKAEARWPFETGSGKVESVL